MDFEICLVDLNPNVVRAWREVFADQPEVRIVQGSMLHQAVSAWVSPTNSEAQMSGGLDAAIRSNLGGKIQSRVRSAMHRDYGGSIPLGYALCVETGRVDPTYLIMAPTMLNTADDINGTMNTVLACAGALHAANVQNRVRPGSIRSLALPGLGAGTGRMDPTVCAELMWNAYSLFQEQDFTTFAEVRAGLEGIVGPLDNQSTLAAAAHARRAAMWKNAAGQH